MIHPRMRLGCLAATLSIGLFGPAHGQTAPAYPTKPIRIVVPFAAGGTSDILARTIGQKLAEAWGQPVIVDNKAGADGNLGSDNVAKSPADGHTLLLLDVATLTMASVFFAKLSYDPLKDFSPVTMIQFSPHALVIHPSLPVSSVKELIAYAKANPGKLNFASSNNAARLAGAQFELETGTTMLTVPYKGAGAAMTAIAGGEVNVTLNGLFVTLPHIKGGKVKGLAVASANRMAAAPELPTIIEGGVPNFVTGSFQGLLAPAGTPKAIVDKINATVVQIIRAPEMSQKLTGMGAEIIGSTPAEFTTFLKDDAAKWLKVGKAANIKPE